MLRIDLHIHTISTAWDRSFEFEIKQLVEHVVSQQLNCIAITNHNTFDLNQYEHICEELNGKCTVLPGVEVSALGTHILVIGSRDNASKIEASSRIISTSLKDTEDTCDEETFFNAFPDLSNYIVIPHYKKHPEITDENLKLLKDFVTAVETSSLAKAMRLKKTGAAPFPPVCFTDYRFGSEDEKGGRPNYRPGSVYLRLDNPSFDQIKHELALGHAQLNSLGNDDVEISPGIAVKRGVNLIIGKRSTGKSFTLERARKCFDEEDVLFIKQGDLVDESQEKTFYSNLDRRFSDVVSKYQKPWKPIVSLLFEIGPLSSQTKAISDYLNDLKSYAETRSLQDAYSKAALFTRNDIEEPDPSEAEELIGAVLTLLRSNDYRDQIDELFDRKQLLIFLDTLISDAKKEQLHLEAIIRTNKITKEVQKRLSVSATSEYPGQPLFRISAKVAFINRCERLIEACWKRQEVFNDGGDTFSNYSIIATREKFSGTEELKKHSGITSPLGNMNGISSREFLERLLSVKKEEQAFVPSALFHVDIGIRDPKGASPSGGQRTECVFLGKLANAKGKKLILVDEPESSFDNVFLNEDIAARIKELGRHSIVLVTTHNSVLGFAMEPDKIIATEYDADEKRYKLLEGSLRDKKLMSLSGDNKNTRIYVREILEAGKRSFDRRANYYKGEE